MFDIRLKVFYTVAKRLNFTKAAEELFISQPAVSKHIQEIEAFYKLKLFERNGTKIKLTQAGQVLLKQVEGLFDVYRNIDFELAALSKNVKGILKIGASTTVSQYFLPTYLAAFKQKFPEVEILLNTNNTEHIEALLNENKIDLGIVEGQSKRQNIKYKPLIKDEIVLCTRTDNPIAKKPVITLADLEKLPMVIREPGSGTLEVIIAALKNAGIDFSNLQIEMVLENIESIKSYLLNSNTFAFISIHAVLKELKAGELKIIDIKKLSIERYFYTITQQGDAHHIQDIFFKHLFSYNFKL